MKVYRGDSNECRQYTVFNVIKKSTRLNYPKPAWDVFFFQPIMSSKSHGERAISVRATEVLLHQYNLMVLIQIAISRIDHDIVNNGHYQALSVQSYYQACHFGFQYTANKAIGLILLLLLSCGSMSQ